MEALLKHYESVRQLAVAVDNLLGAVKKNKAELMPEPAFVQELESIKQVAIEYLLEQQGYQCWIDAPLMKIFTYFWMLNEEHHLLIDGEVRTFRYAYSELIKSW